MTANPSPPPAQPLKMRIWFSCFCTDAAARPKGCCRYTVHSDLKRFRPWRRRPRGTPGTRNSFLAPFDRTSRFWIRAGPDRIDRHDLIDPRHPERTDRLAGLFAGSLPDAGISRQAPAAIRCRDRPHRRPHRAARHTQELSRLARGHTGVSRHQRPRSARAIPTRQRDGDCI